MVTESADARSEAAAVVAAAVAQGLGALDEWQAKTLLAGYGIAVPEGGLARNEDEAAAIARRLDGPVVVKAIGPRISHKTEHGLVALDLRGDEAVRTAARSLLALTEGQDAMLLVERMVRGAREFMIGMKRDPSFGPVVVFGIGGIFAEAHKDIALGVTPLEDRDIEGMLAGIRASALLDDFRGLPPVDRASLAAAIRALARIAEDHPAVTEIDVNPLIVEGATPVAADALVILDPAAEPRRVSLHPARHLVPGSDPPVRAARRHGHRRLERPPQMGRIAPPQPHRRRLRRPDLPRERSWRHRVRSASLQPASRSCRKPRTWRWWRWGPPT